MIENRCALLYFLVDIGCVLALLELALFVIMILMLTVLVC